MLVVQFYYSITAHRTNNRHSVPLVDLYMYRLFNEDSIKSYTSGKVIYSYKRIAWFSIKCLHNQMVKLFGSRPAVISWEVWCSQKAARRVPYRSCGQPSHLRYTLYRSQFGLLFYRASLYNSMHHYR